MKDLKFVDFEENKYFYRVLKEEDGIYKGLVGVREEDCYIKEGKGKKQYKDGRFFEGEFRNDKREGKGVLKLATGEVLKASLEMTKEKEKEFINKQVDKFMKKIEKMIKEKEIHSLIPLSGCLKGKSNL